MHKSNNMATNGHQAFEYSGYYYNACLCKSKGFSITQIFFMWYHIL